MKNYVLITMAAVGLFAVEFIFGEIFGRWFTPNLLILLMIFVDLHLGIRHGIFAALVAGVLQDSFYVGIFGIHTASFVACIYLTTLIRRHLFYDMEFGFLRILMAAAMVIFANIIQGILLSFFYSISAWQAFVFVIIPQVIATVFAATATFKVLKRCVLNLSA